MGEEATAARGFRKGESARFALFASYGAKKTARSDGIYTRSFVIDGETKPDEPAFRVRH
jgi:hypothetical protein